MNHCTDSESLDEEPVPVYSMLEDDYSPIVVPVNKYLAMVNSDVSSTGQIVVLDNDDSLDCDTPNGGFSYNSEE